MSRPRHRSGPQKYTIISKLRYLIFLFSADGEKDSRGGNFATDKEISSMRSSGPGGPRELSKWSPSAEDSKLVGSEFDKEARLGAGWDQFEVNQKLFGVQTSFDESIYTTPIDRAAPDFKQREARAFKLAKEILDNSGNVTNIHLAEERGLVLGTDYDEEDLYGAVVRTGDEAGDQLPAVQMPPKGSRMTQPRKSITNLNANPETLSAAMQAVNSATATVTRRLSQINESDLNTLLSEQGRPRLGSIANVDANTNGSSLSAAKETKLNADAEEFVPSFEAAPVVPASYDNYGGYYGGGAGPSGYYPQGGYYAPQPYYDPNVYYGYPQGGSGYYPPEAYGQPTGYYAPPGSGPNQPPKDEQ